MRKALAIVTLLFVGGCASTERCPETPDDSPIQHITVRSPGGFEQAGIDGDRIFGPDLEVMRYDDAYRGFAFRKQLDLRVVENRIEGIVGVGRTELYLSKYPDGFQLKGLYAGNLGLLRVRSDRLEGHLGGRVYHLRNSPSNPLVYESQTGPAEQYVSMPAARSRIHPGPTEIVLPENFPALSVEHKAALLAIFLGR
jgi:hypothetical protein